MEPGFLETWRFLQSILKDEPFLEMRMVNSIMGFADRLVTLSQLIWKKQQLISNSLSIKVIPS
jgi:hypothetical protein